MRRRAVATAGTNSAASFEAAEATAPDMIRLSLAVLIASRYKYKINLIMNHECTSCAHAPVPSCIYHPVPDQIGSSILCKVQEVALPTLAVMKVRGHQGEDRLDKESMEEWDPVHSKHSWKPSMQPNLFPLFSLHTSKHCITLKPNCFAGYMLVRSCQIFFGGSRFQCLILVAD